jgi:hypothetical protein
MPGVGKVGLGILLLILCVPSVARLSQPAGLAGQRFSVSGWLMRVCHHRPPRGTQRHNSRNPNDPLNAVVEQQSESDSTGSAAEPAAIVHEAVSTAAFILPFIGADTANSIPDAASLCTFLI